MILHVPLVRLPDHTLPDGEKEIGAAIKTALMLLPSYANEIVYSLDLFEHSATMMDMSNLPLFSRGREWRFIAAKACAMALYNGSEAMSAARSQLRLCPTWNSEELGRNLKTIIKKFDTYFPSIEAVRHTVAHEAEFMTKPKESEKHKLHTGGMVMKQLQNDRFVGTYKGAIVSVNINRDTVHLALESFTNFIETLLAATRDASLREVAP